MGLYDRLKTDNIRILSGDDMQEVTLYNSSNGSKAGYARVTNVGIDVSPQGQIFASKKCTIGFNISAFSDIVESNENFKGWRAEFVNSQGETIIGIFKNPLVDKTLDYVSATLTKTKE